MFTVEFESDASIVKTLDQKGKHEDVEVTIASGTQWCVEPEEQLLVELRHILGAEQVNLEFN